MATTVPTGGEVPQPSLRAALRKARADTAERGAVIVQLRAAELSRLDILKERLEPLISGVPEKVEMFDLGVLPGEPARLFIDMVAFVELGHDRRIFRFVQDTRYGRAVLSETQSLDETVQAVTDYVARRLVERERALAADSLTISTAPGVVLARDGTARSGAVKGFGAAVFAAFALGAVAGSAAILAFGWFWVNGAGFAP